MILTELFDRKADYTTDGRGNSQFVINNKNYSVEFAQTSEGVYDVAFGLSVPSASGNQNYTMYSKQGTGDEIAVFSTVVEIIKQFVGHTTNLKTLTFSADVDEESRVGLYDRLLKKFAMNFDVNKQSDSGVLYYSISKKS